MSLGPRLQRRADLRRRRAMAVTAVLVLTAIGIAAAFRLPAPPPVPGTPATSPLQKPVFLRAFGSEGAEPLAEPVGVVVAGGRVYVADAARGEVVVYTPQGSRVSTFGRGRLVTPLYIALNPLDGRLYVSDRKVAGILVFDLRGAYVRTVLPQAGDEPTASPAAWNPLAIAFADSGAMYITDASHRQRILKIGPTGRLVADAGRFVPEGPAGDSVAYANGIAVGNGSVLVADSNNARLLLFDSDLHFRGAVRFAGLPRGIATVAAGKSPVFCVVDTTNGFVSLVDESGKRLSSFDGHGVDGGDLSEPTDVAHDGSGTVYVTDSGNRRVAVWRVATVTEPVPRGHAGADARPRIALAVAIAGLVGATLAFFACARERAAV